MNSKKGIFSLVNLLFILFVLNTNGQITTQCYTIPSGGNGTVLIENGKLYRITIKSCWFSAYARIGTYLIYGLNHADPMTNGEPSVLTLTETESIDWTFSYSLNGLHNATLNITSNGWGDQGLAVFVERFSCATSAEIEGSEIDLDEMIIITYPNPVKRDVIIRTKNKLKDEMILDLINTNGLLIKTFMLNNINNSIMIDLTNLYSGIYIIKTYYNNKLYTYKLIKE